MTLVLCLVLSLVVLATASYTVAGLRSSQTTDGRLDRLAAAEAVVWRGADEVVRTGADGCPAIAPITLNGVEASVACTTTERFRFELTGTTSAGGGSTGVQALIQVVPGTARYQVLRWDILG